MRRITKEAKTRIKQGELVFNYQLSTILEMGILLLYFLFTMLGHTNPMA